jgi:hypothetical protein
MNSDSETSTKKDRVPNAEAETFDDTEFDEDSPLGSNSKPEAEGHADKEFDESFDADSVTGANSSSSSSVVAESGSLDHESLYPFDDDEAKEDTNDACAVDDDVTPAAPRMGLSAGTAPGLGKLIKLNQIVFHSAFQ